MKGNPMDAMVERIEKLERCVRRFKWTGGAVVCLGVVALAMGQKAEPEQTPKVLEVDRIIAREVYADTYNLWTGREIIGTWGPMGKDKEQVVLMMFSPGHMAAPGTDAKRNQTRLTLNVGSGHAQIRMGLPDDRWSSWIAHWNGIAHFSLLEQGQTQVGGLWSASPKDGSKFVLYDKKGNKRAVLGRSETITYKTGVKHQRPESSLVLFDEKGNVVHQVP